MIGESLAVVTEARKLSVHGTAVIYPSHRIPPGQVLSGDGSRVRGGCVLEEVIPRELALIDREMQREPG
ncbi:hypothetical protein GCM10027298_29330 [Epidermidibacterium keratini]